MDLIATRLWFKIATVLIRPDLRKNIFSIWLRINGCDYPLPKDYMKYSTLAEFFSRAKDFSTESTHSTADLISPVDGTIIDFSMLVAEPSTCSISNVKGKRYNLYDFLQITSLTPSPGNEIYITKIYLSPCDNHRFYSPANWNIISCSYIPGGLHPLPKYGLFKGSEYTNERIILKGNWKYGFFSFAAIGAMLVGSINIDQNLCNLLNLPKGGKDPIFCPKSVDLGKFQFGSMIILVFEAPSGTYPKTNGRITVGQGIIG